MEKSDSLRALIKKKDFDPLSQKAFSYRWLKAHIFYQKKTKRLSVVWSLPKKYIPSAVIRNRLKRWGRENLRKTSLKGLVLMIFSTNDKSYGKLKREEFDHVFGRLLEKIQSKN